MNTIVVLLYIKAFLQTHRPKAILSEILKNKKVWCFNLKQDPKSKNFIGIKWHQRTEELQGFDATDVS